MLLIPYLIISICNFKAVAKAFILHNLLINHNNAPFAFIFESIAHSVAKFNEYVKSTRLHRTLSIFGGLEEIRTPDPHNANVVRSQLRYKPIYAVIILPFFGVVKGKGGSR